MVFPTRLSAVAAEDAAKDDFKQRFSPFFGCEHYNQNDQEEKCDDPYSYVCKDSVQLAGGQCHPNKRSGKNHQGK